jgi:hypothetical protein
MKRDLALATTVVVALGMLSGCLAISRSEANSRASASVVINGNGNGDGDVCAAGDGGDGGDSGWIVVRSGEAHDELYTDAVLDAVGANAGAGGAAGQQADADLPPASPGQPGDAGGVEVQPLDCDLSDDPIDPDDVRILNAPTDDTCAFAVDAIGGTVLRYGVPGEDDLVPVSGDVLVEEVHIGPGATFAVMGDLTIRAQRVVLESGAQIRVFAGENFEVLDRESLDGYDDEPGRDGGWLTLIAEDIELGGELVTRGNPGVDGEPGGDAGRLVVFANTLKGALGADRAFGTRALDASGGDGGDGVDAAPCDD